MGALFGRKWFEFTLYHSRHLAKRNKAHYSKLCVADKLAFAITPAWLYLPMVKATGELYEYMAKSCMWPLVIRKDFVNLWLRFAQTEARQWAKAHANLKVDTWTKQRNHTPEIIIEVRDRFTSTFNAQIKDNFFKHTIKK